MKQPVTGLLVAMLVIGIGCGLIRHVFPPPPSEAQLLQNFYEHRACFEQMRDRMQNQQEHTGASSTPAYDSQFQTLLTEAHAIRAFNQAGGPSVLLWISGFAGDCPVVGICWLDQPPTRVVSNMDKFYRDHEVAGKHGFVYRRIDSNWYIYTNLNSEG